MYTVLLFLSFSKLIHGANILAFFTTASISHQAVFQPIWRELSLRGHKITVITPSPLKNQSLVNLTEIDVGYSYNSFKKFTSAMDVNFLPDQFWKSISRYFSIAFDEQMSHPKVRELLEEKRKRFDLVLSEMIYAPSYGFAYKCGCPWVGILSLPAMSTTDKAVGNPTYPALYPELMLGLAGKLDFWKRLKATYAYFRLILRYDYELMPEMDKKAREYFGNDMPYLGDIEKNVSLVLATHNLIVSQPKPKVPALIDIGNIHIKKATTLPIDLKKELDEATQGVVYFSLGSNVKSANISSSLRETIISTFADLPFKILWKWETDYLPGKPSNVIIRKWLPQEAVLAHPNVKLFITQCGLQSLEEAIYYRKPLLGMPFFADQMNNVQRMVEFGIGLQVDVDTVSKKELKSKILEVIDNKQYRENVFKMADLMWDEPMTGLEKAVWWIEYVLRHNGAKHLRSPFLDFPLHQYLMLDIIAFVFSVCTCLLAILYITYKYLVSILISIVTNSNIKKIKSS